MTAPGGFRAMIATMRRGFFSEEQTSVGTVNGGGAILRPVRERAVFFGRWGGRERRQGMVRHLADEGSDVFRDVMEIVDRTVARLASMPLAAEAGRTRTSREVRLPRPR